MKAAINMRCCVQNCANDTKRKYKLNRITFHMFPKEPNTRGIWIKALGLYNWKPKQRSIICSEHFPEDSFYETKLGIRKILSSAIPMNAVEPPEEVESPASLKVCRICLAINVKMHHIADFGLAQLYTEVTGIKLNPGDRLPKMLCWECVGRLRSAKRFRDKAATSINLLASRLDRNSYMTIGDIKMIKRRHHELKSSLAMKCFDNDDCDLELRDEEPVKVEKELDELSDSDDLEEAERDDPEAELEVHEPFGTKTTTKVINVSIPTTVKKGGKLGINVKSEPQHDRDTSVDNQLVRIKKENKTNNEQYEITLNTNCHMDTTKILHFDVDNVNNIKEETIDSKDSDDDESLVIANDNIKEEEEEPDEFHPSKENMTIMIEGKNDESNDKNDESFVIANVYDIINDNIKMEVNNEPDHFNDCNENSNVDNDDEVHRNQPIRSNKAPKTNAERAREFRARQALLKQQSKQQIPDDAGGAQIRTIEKRAKSAEATRRWREKIRVASGSAKKQAKTAAERMREYRARKKFKNDATVAAKRSTLKCIIIIANMAGPSTVNSLTAELEEGTHNHDNIPERTRQYRERR